MQVSGQIVYAIPKEELTRVMWQFMVTRRRYALSVGVFLLIGMLLMVETEVLRTVGGALILYGLCRPLFLYVSLGRTFSQPSLLEQRTLSFDANGVDVIGSDWSSRRGWRHFEGWDEDERYFYLDMTASAVAPVVPKSAMTQTQQELLRSYLQAMPRSGKLSG